MFKMTCQIFYNEKDTLSNILTKIIELKIRQWKRKKAIQSIIFTGVEFGDENS